MQVVVSLNPMFEMKRMKASVRRDIVQAVVAAGQPCYAWDIQKVAQKL